MATKQQLEQVLDALREGVGSMGESDVWQAIPAERAQQVVYNRELLRQWFVPMLAEWAKFLVGKDEYFVMADRGEDNDRGMCLNSTYYFPWRGSYEGNGHDGEAQQDVRSLAIKCFKVSDLIFDNIGSSPSDISYAQKLAQLKEERGEYVLVDAGIGKHLFEEKNYKTLEWIRTRIGYSYLVFPGTEFRPEVTQNNRQKFRYVFVLRFDGNKWSQGFLRHDTFVCAGETWLLMKPPVS